MSFDGGAWTILIFAIVGTYVWRGLGVLLGARIDTEGVLFRWVSSVSYAILAGLIARMIFIPIGSLADSPIEHRLIPILLSFLVFYLFKRNLPLAIVTGVSCFSLLTAMTGS